MQADWHKLSLACTTCKGEVVIQSVLCSADGEILFDLHCAKCDQKLQWVTTGAKLILKALTMDIANCECKKEPERKPVKPPLKQITAQSDKDFLKDMGIEGGLQ